MADEKEAKAQALKIAIDQIEKQHGKGAVMRLGEGPIQQVEVISTGSISLDAALGIGGIPRGRVIEVFGPESSGKTTLALHVIAESQRRGGIAAFVDAEHAMDMNYAKRLGVDTNNLLSQPEFGEQALEIVETLVRSGALDVIVIDSVAALTPRAEIEGEMGDPSMGRSSPPHVPGASQTHIGNLEIQNLRHLHQPAAHEDRRDVRQSRNDNGRQRTEILRIRAHGRPPYRSHQGRHEHHRQPDTRQGREEQGRAPFREAIFDILYNEGISKLGDLIDVAVEHNIIAKSGSWFSYKEDRIGQGRDMVKKFLQENDKLLLSVERETRAKLGLPMPNGTAAAAPDVEAKPSKRRLRKRKLPRNPNLQRRSDRCALMLCESRRLKLRKRLPTG